MAMAAEGGISVALLLILIALAAAMEAVISGAEVWPPAPHAVVAQIRPARCRGMMAAHCHGTIREALQDNEAGAGANAKGRFVILITEGTYMEQVHITRRNVVLLGEGRGKTIISGKLSNKTGTPMIDTATVNALGNGFLTMNLTISNLAGPRERQAVAS